MALEQVLSTIVKRLRSLELWRDSLREPTNSCCLLTNATMSIPNNAGTAITFDTETRDLDGLHDGVNTDRITIKVAGVYVVTGGAYYDQAAGGGRRSLVIYKGATAYNGQSHFDITGAGYISTADEIVCAVGDILRLYVYQTSGGALNVLYARLGATRIA